MTAKIFRNAFLIGFTVLLACILLFFFIMYSNYQAQAFDNLAIEAEHISEGMQICGGESYLSAVQSGELLANFFQHQPYLTQFNKDNGTDLVSVGSIHYEAFAIYSETVTDVANVSADATAAIPHDGSNRARALLLLQDAGLVELKDGGSVSSTKEDVLPSSKLSKDNIREMEAALLPEAMKEVTLAVINGNYALTNQVEAILIEEASVAAAEYANVLCVKRGNEEDPRVVALLEALTSRKVKDFIEQKYNGFVVAVF